ncbi:hypothetical protein INN71_03810 [Nocardioides sp. ChNu-153]|uniref:hypothetical protein n=1 Tax=unclassified Nocardioides TaxID=2615069 RepID=UPI0024051A33|nr:MULTISPECIES: hypothetical protein [unclassified Nocardioides]MDF9717270.1 hypothetical protein [Nocardioides sp. ChNu-99]MDN7120514.1 hypothetical protein [Nocardioides sp. ChNu-153]
MERADLVTPGGDPAWARTAAVVWPLLGGAGSALAPARPASAADEAYELVRYGGRVRYVVDRALPRRGRHAVLMYGNRLRAPRRRAARSLVAAAFLAGPRARAGQVVRVVAERDALRLRALAAASLGRPERELHLSLAVLDRDGTARPTVLVTDAAGTPVLFLKLGGGPERRAALRRERTAALAAARASDLVGDGALLVPRPVLWHDEDGVAVLGTTPLPHDVAPADAADPASTWDRLDALVGAARGSAPPLAESPWLARLVVDVADLVASPDVAVAERGVRCAAVLDAVRRLHGRTVLPHGLRHGDWSSWNLGWSDGGRRLAVWDWEYGEGSAPLALDRHNWQFAHATSVGGASASRAAAELLQRSADPRSAGRVRTGPLTARLYLLDMAVRRAVLAGGGERGSGEAADAILDVLAADGLGRPRTT